MNIHAAGKPGAEVTAAMLRALLWLKNRNGDGVFDRTNVLVAGGERAGVMRSTWTRLEANGMVELYSNCRRVRITESGEKVDLSKHREADSACDESGWS